MNFSLPSSNQNDRSTGTAQAARRIVKTMPKDIPLKREQRYVQPDVAHVSVFTGLFGWALGQKKRGKNGGNKVKFNRQSYGPDGLQAPTGAKLTQAKFNNYFALGTEKDLRPLDTGHQLNVHRNRLIFLVILAGLIIYSLLWISR